MRRYTLQSLKLNPAFHHEPISMLEPCPSSFSGRDGSGPLATSKTKNTEETCLRVDFQCSRVIFNVRTCVKFTFANEIEAVYERSLVSVKVEPRSTFFVA